MTLKIILEYNGIITEEKDRIKPAMQNCLRYDIVNILENKYCSKCSYPLKPEAYDEIKHFLITPFAKTKG
jgi:hypothetical protein